MARLYADANFPLPAVLQLRDLDHDVLTTLETDQAGEAAPDEAVLAFATVQRRVLLTLNRKHFIRLHGVHPQHGRIVVRTFTADFSGLAGRIHEALEQHSKAAGNLFG